MSSSWNLPPGCTPRDIDRAAGELTICATCGREVYRESLNEDGDCRRCTQAAALEDTRTDPKPDPIDEPDDV